MALHMRQIMPQEFVHHAGSPRCSGHMRRACAAPAPTALCPACANPCRCCKLVFISCTGTQQSCKRLVLTAVWWLQLPQVMVHAHDLLETIETVQAAGHGPFHLHAWHASYSLQSCHVMSWSRLPAYHMPSQALPSLMGPCGWAPWSGT